MELLHWSELAGLVVVAQVVFPRCSTAVLQVAQDSQFAVLVLRRRGLSARRDGSRHPRRAPSSCTNGPSQPCTANAAQALARVSAPTSLGERSLCCAPPSPWLDMAGARSSATTLVSEGL